MEKPRFGTLFRLKTFRIHGGGKGALGVVLDDDGGKSYDNFSRPFLVVFEDCPKRRFRLGLKDMEIINANPDNPDRQSNGGEGTCQ